MKTLNQIRSGNRAYSQVTCLLTNGKIRFSASQYENLLDRLRNWINTEHLEVTEHGNGGEYGPPAAAVADAEPYRG